MKKKVLIISIAIGIIIILVLLFFIFDNNKFMKANTYIYDKNGNEIAVIEYGRNIFKNVKTEHLEATLNSILDDIMTKENVSRDEAKNILSTGGYKIYTTQDTVVLNILEKIYTTDSNFEVKDIQSATVVIDNTNGQVAALIGGRNYAAETPNRAIKFNLQPGLAITPLSVYTYGIDKGIMNLDSIYVDEPLQISSWKPQNYYGTFKGKMTVKEAFNISSNVVAVKIAKEIGTDNMYKFLQDIGFSSLDKNDNNLASLALGGLTKGVSVVELANAYSTIANGGEYRTPIYYTKILNNKGKVYLEKKQEKRAVINNSTSVIMKGLMKVDLNGKEVYIRAAGTSDNRDNWSMGFADKYTISTWCGYDTRTTINSNTNEAKKVWELIVNDMI